MSTLSVPLDAELITALEHLITDGVFPNKAEAMRQALRHYLRELAIQEILKAQKEPRILLGDVDDLDGLAKKF